VSRLGNIRIQPNGNCQGLVKHFGRTLTTQAGDGRYNGYPAAEKIITVVTAVTHGRGFRSL
jgi:hypothetical protein